MRWLQKNACGSNVHWDHSIPFLQFTVSQPISCCIKVNWSKHMLTWMFGRRLLMSWRCQHSKCLIATAPSIVTRQVGGLQAVEVAGCHRGLWLHGPYSCGGREGIAKRGEKPVFCTHCTAEHANVFSCQHHRHATLDRLRSQSTLCVATQNVAWWCNGSVPNS